MVRNGFLMKYFTDDLRPRIILDSFILLLDSRRWYFISVSKKSPHRFLAVGGLIFFFSLCSGVFFLPLGRNGGTGRWKGEFLVPFSFGDFYVFISFFPFFVMDDPSSSSPPSSKAGVGDGAFYRGALTLKEHDGLLYYVLLLVEGGEEEEGFFFIFFPSSLSKKPLSSR